MLFRSRVRNSVLYPKDPSETLVLTFNFQHILAVGESISSVVSTTIETFGGRDSGPSLGITGITIINVNSPWLVQQPITGGLDGCTYKVKMTVMTNENQILSGIAILPVVAQ